MNLIWDWIEPEVWDRLYPETDVILLLESGDTPVGVALRHRASFLYLRNLLTRPLQDYEVVCRRWDEFNPPQPDFSKTQLFHIDLNS